MQTKVITHFSTTKHTQRMVETQHKLTVHIHHLYLHILHFSFFLAKITYCTFDIKLVAPSGALFMRWKLTFTPQWLVWTYTRQPVRNRSRCQLGPHCHSSSTEGTFFPQSRSTTYILEGIGTCRLLWRAWTLGSDIYLSSNTNMMIFLHRWTSQLKLIHWWTLCISNILHFFDTLTAGLAG